MGIYPGQSWLELVVRSLQESSSFPWGWGRCLNYGRPQDFLRRSNAKEGLRGAFLDPLQFAYQPQAFPHLENQGSTVRVFCSLTSPVLSTSPSPAFWCICAPTLHPRLWTTSLAGHSNVRVDGTSRNYSGAVPLHSLHLRFQFQLRFLWPSNVFWRLLHCWMRQQRKQVENISYKYLWIQINKKLMRGTKQTVLHEETPTGWPLSPSPCRGANIYL